MNPGIGAVGRQPDQGGADLDAGIPFEMFGVDRPTKGQHFRMVPRFRCDLFKLGVCRLIVAKLEPPLGGAQAVQVRYVQRLYVPTSSQVQLLSTGSHRSKTTFGLSR